MEKVTCAALACALVLSACAAPDVARLARAERRIAALEAIIGDPLRAGPIMGYTPRGSARNTLREMGYTETDIVEMLGLE